MATTIALAWSAGCLLWGAPQALAHPEKVTRDGVEYTCKDLPADYSEPPPPTEPPAGSSERRPAAAPPLCPRGHAPQPLPTDATAKGPPPASPVIDESSTTLACGGDVCPNVSLSPANCVQNNPNTGAPAGCYWYIQLAKRYADWSGVTGMVGFQSQERPFAAGVAGIATDHSIGQLWAIDDDQGTAPYSTVEVGWRRVPGEPQPRLFVFRFDNGVPRCYVGSRGCEDRGWQAAAGATETPNQYIGFADTFHRYEIKQHEGNWWVWHDNAWLGYYTASSWNRWPNRINRVEFGGEVFEIGGTAADPPCTDMGNGVWGNWGNAAMFSQTYRAGSWGSEYMTSAGMRRTRSPDNREPYRIGFFNAGNVGDFRYGGPGFC